MRLGHVLLGPAPIEALLYADDLETMGVGKEGRRCQVLLFVLLAAFGSPFKWKKQRGGLVTEWIGLTTDYGSYSLGLSERRASWLVDWISRVCQRKLVWPGEFASMLGAAGFCSNGPPMGEAIPGATLHVGSSSPRTKGRSHCALGNFVHSGLDLPEVERGWPDGDGGRGGPVGSRGGNLLY